MHVTNSLADRQFVGVFGNAENSTLLDLCDIDNDEVGCQQLCVLVRAGHRQCACSVGFYLADDQRSCISGSLAVVSLTIIQFIIIIIIITIIILAKKISHDSGDERETAFFVPARFRASAAIQRRAAT